jgi:peptide/nickel transport system permease protein
VVQASRSPSLAPTADVAKPVTGPRRRPSVLAIVSRHPLGVVGGTLIVLLVALAALAPLIAPFDPIEQPARRLQPPSGSYLLGTDEFGRDIISRLIFGARVSLQVGVISVGLALLIGGVLGLVSGYFLGGVDIVVQRIVDIMLAFPSVILIIALAGVLGPSLLTAMIAIGIVYAPSFARIARGSTLAISQDQYVEAARALGAGAPRIISRHVLPNIAAPLIVQTTLAFSTAILAEAALSFLGLGTQPPDPSWGTMLGAGRRYMELAPWVAIYPGLAIMLSVLGFNLLGDALRDALDPRLRVP